RHTGPSRAQLRRSRRTPPAPPGSVVRNHKPTKLLGRLVTRHHRLLLLLPGRRLIAPAVVVTSRLHSRRHLHRHRRCSRPVVNAGLQLLLLGLVAAVDLAGVEVFVDQREPFFSDHHKPVSLRCHGFVRWFVFCSVCSFAL
ncbi:unnamed protein product, partial [Linum tenue]